MSEIVKTAILAGLSAWIATQVIEWHCEYVNRVDKCQLVAVPVTDEKGE